MRVPRARLPASSAPASASISRKPSACEKLVTAPEPLAVGNATGPPSPAVSATRTNSLRPSSEAMRTGTAASMLWVACVRPVRARIAGATKAWKVKIAEVGNPGGHRFPTSFSDGSRDDRPVAVVYPCGAERVSRRRKLVAGREHGDSWPAQHLDLGEAAGGEHPDFTR